MSEEPKRLAPTSETLRRLFSLSGNICYFPGCTHLMIDLSGNFIGQICHIEAAMPGGERFNKGMSNEQRRDFNNLMLLCYEHHVTTNDVFKYDAPSLKTIKNKHERIFSEDLVIDKLLLSLKDYTKGNTFKKVSNLKNLLSTIWSSNHDTAPDELEDLVKSFNSSIEKYLNLTPYSRKVFETGLARSNHPYRVYRIDNESLYVDFAEVCSAFGKEKNNRDIWSSVQEIEAKKLMIRTEVCISDDDYEHSRHVYSNCLDSNEYDINIWLLLKNYCEKKDFYIQDYLSALNFEDLDV
ncbi:hypothetical protein LQK91_21385 [Pantoea sp. MHSD4]|uniref:hypothetical protein n=1 Tax=Pantoea sp. MHSD4 TaxID=2898077 RepID=UPI0011B7B439|nr:hypothetical protein [Pantoea sp. MHSD4]MCD2358958.1 hypothetical protein [Pantoea sp. MHSD4]